MPLEVSKSLLQEFEKMSDFIDGFEFDDDAIVDFIIEFIKQNPEKFITPDLKRRQRRREDFSIAEVALALHKNVCAEE